MRQEKLQQRHLCVQSILRFVPDDAVWALERLGGNFLTSMRRQAMHQQCIRACSRYQSSVYLKSREIRNPPRLAILLAHACPHIGDDQIRIDDGLGRVMKQLHPCTTGGDQLPIGLVTGGARRHAG